jgi:hypothetical protein
MSRSRPAVGDGGSFTIAIEIAENVLAAARRAERQEVDGRLLRQVHQRTELLREIGVGVDPAP